ncbi:hypothetical protein V6N13_053141 [Hibiscus sabdariffa]|uniref:Calponin-homology (CH) domain-containing protein n=1 Tax=Hibiscus sabdariffa TaxID=183260 RepID=A0ABR2Q6E6_9ROSI
MELDLMISLVQETQRKLDDMPSEDEFRLGLRSGKILCTALNKIESGSVPKLVEGPDDSVIIPDGSALSEYPFFENVTNFLNVIGELGIPPFEATNLEQGGKSSRIVQCVLALKSYSEGKKSGAISTWRYIESPKPISELTIAGLYMVLGFND